MVVPNGTLFGDGVCARIKAQLLEEFNLHTIVRLPNGVFAPYTSIPTNLLFFDRSGPTKCIWYYEMPLPEGRKNYSKTKPIQYEEFAECLAWWKKRKENGRAWKVKASEVIKRDDDGNLLSVNLDIKNPNAAEALEHLPPEQLVEDILAKETADHRDHGPSAGRAEEGGGNVSKKTSLIPTQRIERAILLLRGQKVILDRDLAALYEVETKILNQAVRRNRDRFPRDFMFQLTDEEFENWRSQIVTSNPAAKMGVRRKPYAFTEEGVAMLSSVLRSARAVAVNIEIMRSFVRLRQILASHSDLARKLEALEGKYDAQFRIVFDAIRQLTSPPPRPPQRPIGFHTKPEGRK